MGSSLISRFTRCSILCCFIILFSLSARAQSAHTNWSRVDNIVKAYPAHNASSIDTLVAFVKRNFSADSERVRAYYTWIATNIIYDKDLLDQYRVNTGFGLQMLSSLRTQQADTVFKYRKAVCEGICLLMNACCEKSCIRSFLVSGVTEMEGIMDEKILHTWNAVLVDSVWRLLDITWSGGHINPKGEYVRRFSDSYFFTEPGVFVRDHWPLDAMWQLLDRPVSKNAFMNDLPDRSVEKYNYRDSINRYIRLSKEDREFTDLQHYHAADPANEKYTRASDYVIYNKAVTIFNLASLYFEDYVSYAAQLEGKPVTRKTLSKCIRLLAEPKKLLEEGLAFSANRKFFHGDVGTKFSNMVRTSEQRLKEINDLLNNYYRMQRAY